MINSRNNFNDEDYKYVSVIDLKTLKNIFESVIDEYNPNYSLVVLYKGKTYILSVFTLEDKSLKYSIMEYRNVKSKDRSFDSKKEFYNAVEQLLSDEFIVLNDILYKDNDILYYPVTTNKYLSDNIVTRNSEYYKQNLPDYYGFKTLNKVFSLLMIFMFANILIASISIMYHVNIKDIILGIVCIVSALVSLVVIIRNYTFKTSIVNGLISSSKLFAFNKTYKFEDINYIDDVVCFNLFSTRKIYNIHMKDKRVVKIKYFNSSTSSDDVLKEMIIYLREMFITNKIKINKKENNNKLIIIISILLYAISIIVL